MKTIDLKCSSCGGTMQVSADKTTATCPYCKNSMLIQSEPNLAELTKKTEQLTYARETAKLKAAEESEKRQKKSKFTTAIIIIFVLLVLAGVGLGVTYYSLEPMDNPFECINVKYNGIDGQGTIEIIDNEKCENFSEIEFTPSKEENLNEGEKIKIIASSSTYRFNVSSNEYKVEGLSKYLTSLDSLDDEIIKKIHDYSYNELKNNTYGITFDGEVVSLTPYKLYLYSNGSKENVLYDVYETEIKTDSGKKFKKYVVAYYENFLLLSNKESFSYKRLYHCGNTIKAGDPTVMSAMDDDYAGFMTGFETIEDFKSYLNEDNDGSFEITEK